MRDHRSARRLAGALAAGLLTAFVASPGVLAQEVPPPTSAPDQPPEPPTTEPAEPEQPGSWGASSFDPPFDEPGATLRDSTFDIAGTMRYEKTGPSDDIREVEIRVVDDPGDSFAPADECPLPEPVASQSEGPTPGLTAEHAFFVEGASLPCNGRYLVQAEGRLDDPAVPSHTLQQSFVVAVEPAAVTGLEVTADRAARSVTATFQPLEDTQVPFDAIGYVLERAERSDPEFVDVATIGPTDEPRLVDPLSGVPAGSYTYRVRAVRAGPDGEVRSGVDATESDTVEIEGEPRSTATTSGARAKRGSVRPSAGRVSVPRSGSARPTTPTTLDTGFEDTLDYGEPGSEDALAGDEPVAGQSIVRDEAEGMGLAVPAAGALVMLGWAGHILYLNRLARLL